MGKNSRFPYAILKKGPEPLLHRDRTEYPHHRRACQVYSQWLAGYFEDELAAFFAIPVREVEFDIQHIHGVLPTRTIIEHRNDRNRLLLQRTESESYRQLVGQALRVPATDYLKSGISPAGPLREFREATGMISKADTLSMTVHQTMGMPQGKLTSAEDILRLVLLRMNEE